jgi:hypothetical protein
MQIILQKSPRQFPGQLSSGGALNRNFVNAPIVHANRGYSEIIPLTSRKVNLTPIARNSCPSELTGFSGN